MKHKKITLSQLIFMALCCDLGVFSKKLIAPAANVITDLLHIPGGIGTGFSLMFVIMGAAICDIPGCAILMCVVQSFIAFAVGTSGSMGILAPIGYIVPGFVIDIFLYIIRKHKWVSINTIAIANAIAGASAALCANMITFRLTGIVLLLYLSVAFTSGVIFGYLGTIILKRLKPILKYGNIYNL